MPPRWHAPHGGHHAHPTGTLHGPCLYELVLREAIAAQHGLSASDRLELRACAGCGKPYLLASVWQPLSEEGEIACPRCGAQAVAWEGARGYLAYWQRESGLPDHPAGGMARPPR